MKLPKPEDIMLFEDDNIVVFNKPASLTSESDSGGGMSLALLARRRWPTAMLCHRLDKETSGVIIAAKNEETYRHFSIMFQKRKIRKDYHALVEGVRRFENKEINIPLGKQGNYKAVIDRREGKDAVTIINSLEFFKHHTLLLAQPITGRFHQIRIHLATLGFPIVGDAMYGGKPFYLSSVKRRYNTSKYQEEELAVMNRTALHAYALEFENMDGKQLRIEAPYPKDYAVTLKLLREYDAINAAMTEPE
jgi:23S rRNA pseudouridine955/2504/2580 synthase